MFIPNVTDLAAAPRPNRRLGLGEISFYDPRLAATLYRCGMAPGGYVDVGGWEMLSVVGRFESGAANATVDGQFLGIVEADLWVRAVKYTVRRPNAFAGNIFKAQSDYFNMMNPNIDFTMTINSYCKYLISPNQTPLENIREQFECACPVGLVLRCAANFDATFTILRALADDEVPTEAIITLSCTRLPANVYGSCQQDAAVAMLREIGAYWDSPGIHGFPQNGGLPPASEP